MSERGARHAGRSAAGLWGAGARKMARQFEVRHCRSPPSDREPYRLYAPFYADPVHVYCVCLGGKWSGEWQISRNFGACGAAGKFFSKFRETLACPNPWLKEVDLRVQSVTQSVR